LKNEFFVRIHTIFRSILLWQRYASPMEPFALRSFFFVSELTDDLSKAMVKRIQNRYGVEIWPWERAGFNRSRKRTDASTHSGHIYPSVG
jgi:hypothetical protein